jgi:hypothetical protein
LKRSWNFMRSASLLFIFSWICVCVWIERYVFGVVSRWRYRVLKFVLWVF